LESQLYTYAWDLLQNFMDLIEVSIPLVQWTMLIVLVRHTASCPTVDGEQARLNRNDADTECRKYYLNRSQPPVFVSVRLELP